MGSGDVTNWGASVLSFSAVLTQAAIFANKDRPLLLFQTPANSGTCARVSRRAPQSAAETLRHSDSWLKRRPDANLEFLCSLCGRHGLISRADGGTAPGARRQSPPRPVKRRARRERDRLLFDPPTAACGGSATRAPE